jgi:hypothetical protein
VDRIVRSALSLGEQLLFERVGSRLTGEVAARMLALIGDAEAEDGSAVFAAIRSDPGTVSLTTMLSEIAKLEAVRAVGLPMDVFADVSPKIVAVWRARASVESPSHLRRHAPVRDRVRHHETAGLRPVAADQADQQVQAVPARGRRARAVARACTGDDPADSGGS